MSQMSERVEPNELVRLLERQRDVFQQLRTLADRQRTLVAQDDPTPLLTLLGDRQRLVDDLTRCNFLLGPYRRNWSALMTKLGETERSAVEELLVENDRILGSILTTDQRDSETLRSRQEATAALLTRASGGGPARRAYAASGYAGRATSGAAMTDAMV